MWRDGVQKMLGVIGFGVGIYAFACLALFFMQRSYIYHPIAKPMLAVPHMSALAMPGAVVKVSERPVPGPRALIYLGGNAEDVTASLPALEAAFPDCALYLLHYRGYLGSSGSPSEAALVADALALFDRVAGEHADIVVVGRSLGSGIAVQVASRRPVKRLVLVTPYDSLQEIAATHFPYFPVRWLLRDKYESWRYAPQVQAPTLLIAAEHDAIIPAPSTRRLLSRFRAGVATLAIVRGAGHNTVSASPAYLSLLQGAR